MTHLSHAKALTGLVVTAAAVTGLAAPAHAAFQKTVQLTCEYPLIGTVPVSARFTAGIPQSVPAGVPTPQYPVTIDQISGTNPESATSSWAALKIIRAASLSGVATTSATVRAPDLEESITFDADLAKYTVPAIEQDLILQATGTLPSLTFPRTGLATIDIDGFALNLRALRNDGLPVVGLPPITVDSDGDPNTFDVPCAVDAGQDTTLAGFSIGDPATPEELPTKPGTPVASAITTTGATLTWGASTDTAGPTPGVVRYDVYEGSKKIGTTDSTSVVVTGLAPGAHTVTVRAIDGDGNYSAASDAVTFTVERPPNTAPSQPGKPTAGTITPTSIDVYWAASNDPYDTVRYEVQEGGVVVAESDVNLVRVSGLTPDVEHCFTVVAIDAAGLRSEPSEETCFTTPLATPSPTPTPPPTPRPTPGPGAFTLNSELPLVGEIPFLVDLKASIPATTPVGGASSAIAIAGTLTGGTNSETATSLWLALKIFRAASLEGVARLDVTVNGGGIDNLGVTVNLDIEKYVPPATQQDLPLVVRGSTPPLRFTQATPVEITINSITLNLRGTKANGDPVTGLPPVDDEDSDGNPETFDAPGEIEGGPFKLGNGTIVLPGGTPTPTPRPTPTPVGLPTPYPTPTPTPRSTPVIGIPIPSPTPTPTPRPTLVPGTPVPTVKPTPTPTPWPTPVPGTPVPTVRPTPTPTPTPRPTPVIGIPIPSPTPTPRPSVIPTPTGLPAPTATPTPPPTTKLGYDLTGAATLKTLTKGTLPLKGSVAATLEGSSGKVSADLNLQPTKARLTALGFLPVTASVAFVPNGKTTGTLLGSTLQTTSNVRIKLPQVSVLGLPIAGGTTCQTRELSKIDLSSTAFSAAAGGTLSGTFAISNLSGCGILNGLVSPLTAGGGNTISAKLTPGAAPTT